MAPSVNRATRLNYRCLQCGPINPFITIKMRNPGDFVCPDCGNYLVLVSAPHLPESQRIPNAKRRKPPVV